MARDTRVTPADQGLEGFDVWTWPITYRYYTLTYWGFSQTEITIDCPLLLGDLPAVRGTGQAIWDYAIAPATSSNTSLWGYEFMQWRGSPAPELVVTPHSGGQRSGSSSSQEHSAQLVLMTGEKDRRWRRRVFLPGVPAHWFQGGLLQKAGWEHLMTTARILYMGLNAIHPNPISWWAICYRDAVEKTFSNPYGVAFKRVKGVRVCWHSDRAPDFTPL